MRLVLPLALLMLLIPSGACAQARVLVLPTLSDATRVPAAHQLAAQLEVELRAQGTNPLAPQEAGRLLSQNLSAPAAVPEQDTFDEIVQCMDEVLVLTASQQVGRARDLGRRCLGLAEAALETLNRRTEAAQQVLDGCLYGVRAILESAHLRHSRTAHREGQAEARHCRALVPDLHPTTRMHPPAVLDVFAEVDRQIGEGRSELRVWSRESGCAVYLNGRRLGATPFVQRGLPGAVYRVQVECEGVAGRVHRVQLGSEPTELNVDERFDSVIADSPRPHLLYRDGMTASGHRLDDATLIGRAVAASEAWLLASEDEARWRLDRVLLPSGRVAASARLSAPSPSEGFAFNAGTRSVTLLQQGESRDLAGPRERPLETWNPPPLEADATTHDELPASPTSDQDGWSPHPLAWISLASGVAALGTSWTLSFVASQDFALDEGLAVAYTTTGAAGGLLTALALPNWLPAGEELAWGLSIPAGLGGAALLIYGAVTLSEDGRCTTMIAPEVCQHKLMGNLATVVAFSAAVPLLEVPIVYAVRALTGSHTTIARLETTPFGALFSVGDSF